MKELFVERKFSQESQKTIVICKDILDEYRRQILRLSLRQLY